MTRRPLRSRRKTRKRSKRSRGTRRYTSVKYTHCPFLGKEFTRDELLEIAKIVGVGQHILPLDDSEDICFKIEYYCPECVDYINYIIKNYIFYSVQGIFWLLMASPFATYSNWFKTLSAQDVESLSLQCNMSKENLTSGFESIGEMSNILYWIYIPYLFLVNIVTFRNIYSAYKNNKIINKLGRKVRKVTKNTKMEIHTWEDI